MIKILDRIKKENAFLKGFVSCFDLFGSSFKLSDYIETDDTKALKSDWMAISKDIKNATNQFKNNFIK